MFISYREADVKNLLKKREEKEDFLGRYRRAYETAVGHQWPRYQLIQFFGTPFRELSLFAKPGGAITPEERFEIFPEGVRDAIKSFIIAHESEIGGKLNALERKDLANRIDDHNKVGRRNAK